jgi:protein-S-isoprenylcysteine O-methyltransferase Ste14
LAHGNEAMNPSAPIWFVYALWLLLIVYLSVSAIGAKPDTERHLVQSFGLLFAMIAAFLLPRLSLFSFVNFAPEGPVATGLGLALAVLGAAFLVWARQCLGTNWSQTVSAKQVHELVTTGPYRLVRHPMYAGGLVASLGSAIVAGGAFVFLLVLLGAIFLWRVGAEDELMAQQFPVQYPEYKKRNWALFPFIY